jgi:hypothetical protein
VDQSGADTAASTSAVFDSLPDPSGLPGNQTALWLAASVAASPASWDVLVRRRLFQLVDAWLAGSALPPPPQGASSLVTENHLALLVVIALLRLRGGRLALMASINRKLFGDDKRSELLAIGPGGKLELGLAALGEQIDAVLAQESARGDPQATPPWPALTCRTRRRSPRQAHPTGQALAHLYAGFDAALAAAGTAAVAQRDARAASVETAIAGAVRLPSLAAQGLDFLEQPACGLLVLPAFRFAQTPFATLRDAAAAATPASRRRSPCPKPAPSTPSPGCASTPNTSTPPGAGPASPGAPLRARPPGVDTAASPSPSPTPPTSSAPARPASRCPTSPSCCATSRASPGPAPALCRHRRAAGLGRQGGRRDGRHPARFRPRHDLQLRHPDPHDLRADPVQHHLHHPHQAARLQLDAVPQVLPAISKRGP